MIPTASSLYMRTPVGMPYNISGQTYYGGSYSAVTPQSYYNRSPSSYQIGPQLRLPGVAAVGSQSPSAQAAPTQPLTSQSAVMNDDTPVTTRRFNAYKENRDLSQMNASSASLRIPQVSASAMQSGALPPDFGQMVKQAVAEAVRAEKGQMSPASFSGAPADLKQLEDVIMKEREERKTLKAQLKQEKKQCETLQDKIKSLEKARSDVDLEMKRMERENINRGKEIEILQAELSDLRNEKILSEQLDEEHSAKMKVYTKDLMATSQKYQQDIQNLIAKNEKLTKEVELLKAKGAELERQAEHAEQVKDALNRKLIGKDNDISSLQSQLEKVMKEKKLVESSIGQQKPAPSFNKPDVSAFANRIKELEAIVEAQKQTIQDHENRVMNTSADDAFGILRSAKAVTPARRVSHLTSRREAQSYVPAPTADWLEPLAIAEHVLTTIS